MNRNLRLLIALAHDLQKPHTLEALLQRVVDATAVLTESPRAGIRLLDPSRAKLLAVCRSGRPIHMNPDEEFRIGEGLMGWIVANGTPIRTSDADNDPRFAPRPGMLERLGSFIGVPIIAGSVCLGVLTAVRPEPDVFTSDHEEELALIAAICAPYIEMSRLARLATVDPLTGALNRRGFDRIFPEVAAPDKDLVMPLGVAMLDIDHFKRVNDEHGHATGDLVLKQVTRILSGLLRGGDAVVRYGGEEFLLILRQADRATTARVAERARTAIEATELLPGDQPLRVTASFGVAERKEGESREQLLARADEALYDAKRAGRNRVVLAM